MDALATLSFLPLRLSRNAVAYIIDAASDSITDRAGLVYTLRLKKPKTADSGEFSELVTLPGRELPKRTELGADVYPGAQFEVGVFLDDFLKRTPPQPDQSRIVACADQITPFLTNVFVQNNGVLITGSDKTLPLEYCLKGAIGIEQFAVWRDQFFTTYLNQSRQFLTWQPAAKWVDVAQPEYLYYLVNFTPKPSEIRLRMDVAYTDGSTDSLTGPKLSSIKQYMVYGIPVGFSAMGLSAQELAVGKQVLSYQVWVANESNQRLSEVRTYYVNREYEPNILYLLFANSLGGYDTLRCTGQRAQTLTATGTAAQRALSPDYLPTSAELFSLDRRGVRVLTVNTGLMDGDQLDYLTEITLTEEIYVVTQEGFVALEPTETALNLRTDDEDLAGRTLSYRYAKNEVGFSALPVAPATPARPTVWVPTNTFCLINENGVRTGYLGAAKLQLRYVDDGSLVKPLRSKANTPGTEGYVAPTLSGACSTTPFVNVLIQKPGTYYRNNCGADQQPTVATLTIAAGTYGGETAEQLQSRVDAALRAMDTQAYANTNGSCLTDPANYSYSVPANRWHYRANVPSRIGIETAGSPYMGNAWTMQDRGGSFIFGVGSNDLDFPSTSFDADQWRFFSYGTAGASGRLRLYKNGTKYLDKTFTYNSDGYEYHALFKLLDNSLVTVASTDRIYVQLTDS